MKAKQLIESAVEKSLWLRLRRVSDRYFGEFGLATLEPVDRAKLINVKLANALAVKEFGEFNFSSLSDKQMKKIIDTHPDVVKVNRLTSIEAAVLDMADQQKEMSSVLNSKE